MSSYTGRSLQHRSSWSLSNPGLDYTRKSTTTPSYGCSRYSSNDYHKSCSGHSGSDYKHSSGSYSSRLGSTRTYTSSTRDYTSTGSGRSYTSSGCRDYTSSARDYTSSGGRDYTTSGRDYARSNSRDHSSYTRDDTSSGRDNASNTTRDNTSGGREYTRSNSRDRVSSRAATDLGTTAAVDTAGQCEDNDQNQNRSRGKASGQLKSGHPPDVVSTSARGTRAQEVARLESLCEGRTKELNYTKMQLKAGLQGFDAMACLLNYCTNQLDAFSCPEVTAKLKVAEGHISEQHKQIESLGEQKAGVEQRLTEVTQARDAALTDVSRLQQELKDAAEANAAATQQLKDEHAVALSSQQENLHSQHHHTTQQLQKYHEKQLEYTQQAHQRQISEQTAEHQMATNQLRVAHLEEIQELRNKHDKQMEELHAQHRNKLEDITRRFEGIKISLSEKVESLCVECDDLRVRARTSEDALQRDADVKVQLALTPYLHLPKEIESLRTVVDMRTEEIQKLRRQNMDLEKQLEELPIAQERVTSLQQKVENLQAIINIKTDHEKQLHEKCQVLMRKYDRESRANKRLSMDYEQVMWRMSQSADFTGSTDLVPHQFSHSPTRGGEHPGHGSPSPVRRSISQNAQGDGVGVTRRQRKTSGGDEDFDRKIRCRSATFVMDKIKAGLVKNGAESEVNGAGSAPESMSGSPNMQALSRSADYAEEIAAALGTEHDESWSSGHFSADPSELQSSLETSVTLDTSKDFFQTPQGVSYSVLVAHNGDRGAPDDIFAAEDSENDKTTVADETAGSMEGSCKANVTVMVNSPVSD